MNKVILIKVGDTETNANNLRIGKYPFWGLNKNHKNSIESLKKGTIIAFITNKQKNGNRVIGMAEFVSWYDRRNEPLLNINTVTNEKQGWVGDGEWEIQVLFKNFYETESGIKNIWIPNEIDIGRQQMIIGIEGHKIQLPDSITDDLLKHYQNFKYYGIPKVYPELVV
jgi:hypothetical protein